MFRNWFKKKGAGGAGDGDEGRGAGYVRKEDRSVRAFYTTYTPFFEQTPEPAAAVVARLEALTKLPRKAELYPVDAASVASASAALVSAARDVLRLVIDPHDGDATQMDRFADHVVDPAIRRFFLDGRPRPDLSEANQEAYGAAVEALRVVNEPLLYYAMGAFWGDWLVNHRGATWALEAPLNPVQSFPDMITSSHTACLHPFSQVNKRLSDPEGDNLEFKCSPGLVRKYVPPLPLIASLADADYATGQLLPPAGRKARAMFEAGDAGKAFLWFTAAVDESPKNATLLSHAAACALSAEQYEAAGEWMRRLLAMHPDIPLINHNLAIVASMTGDTEEATRLLRHAVKMDPNYSRARITLASMLAEAGATREAVEQAKWVVENEGNEELLNDAKEFLAQVGQ